ncbi:MAG: dTMP kinase [Pseudomonadota bacterium]
MDALIDWKEGVLPPHYLFIVFEGVDGAGKTTQQRRLAAWLRSMGYETVETREPSEGPVGRQIRSLRVRPDKEEEARLFARDRKHHVDCVIWPALARGAAVLCDRYVYSSFAYQGARGVEFGAIKALSRCFLVRPTAVFLLDVPPETGIARIASSRPEGFSIFERIGDLERVARIYRGLDDPLIRRIDAGKTEDEVHEVVVVAMKSLIADKDTPNQPVGALV